MEYKCFAQCEGGCNVDVIHITEVHIYESFYYGVCIPRIYLDCSCAGLQTSVWLDVRTINTMSQ